MTAGITTNDELDTLSDRELLARLIKGVDHLDMQVHELCQLVDQHRPLLARLAPLMDPGAGIRDYLKTWRSDATTGRRSGRRP